MYISKTSCISPQGSFNDMETAFSALNNIITYHKNILHAIEPLYENIPPTVLRRMGRAVRLGVGAALPLIDINNPPDGIILGTSMGGLEDCVRFLNQIIEYNEGTLTPTNFVQSTANAVAGQLGLLSRNKGYNITHVHRGFSFENALLDAQMSLTENPGKTYLVGAVDEISAYNYNIERLEGSYKQHSVLSTDLYSHHSAGSIAGEGSAMFLVNNEKHKAIAALRGVHIVQADNVQIVQKELKLFLKKHLKNAQPNLFLSGENADNRFGHFYDMAEEVLHGVTIARFKHLVGEYPTATAFGCWLACGFLNRSEVPGHFYKTGISSDISSVLIYNHYKGVQHSFMLLESMK